MNFKVDKNRRFWPMIMIDLETLSLRADAVIMEIAAVCFDPAKMEMGPEIVIHPNIQDQIDRGRAVDGDTLAWWFKQPDGPRESVLTEGPSWYGTLPLALRVLAAWLDSHADLYVSGVQHAAEYWCHVSYDAAVLDHAARSTGEPPLHYKRFRDIRTLEAMWNWAWNAIPDGTDGPKFDLYGPKHTALADCKNQICVVTQMLHDIEGVLA